MCYRLAPSRWAGPVAAPLAPIVSSQAPTTPAEAYAPCAGRGAVAGQILYTGPSVKRVVLGTAGHTSFPVRIGSEDLIVNGDGTLRNVVVYVKQGLSPKTYPTPTRALVLDLNKYRFDPHVLGVQVGQTVQLRNADPDYHSPRFTGATFAPRSFAQPKQGMRTLMTFPAPEMGVTASDAVFPWMSGYICVLSHPHFNVTNTAGLFRLEDLPPGAYVLEAWHEKLGTKQVTVTVQDGQVTRAVIRF